MVNSIHQHNLKKEALNKQMLANQATLTAQGKGPDVMQDTMEAYGHGLRGKHGNAIYLIYENKDEIKKMMGLDKVKPIKGPEIKWRLQ